MDESVYVPQDVLAPPITYPHQGAGVSTQGSGAVARRKARRPIPSIPKVSVVIPALNEAENLLHVLPLLSHEYEVILVDGHSEDGTADVAKFLRPDIRIVQQQRRGKGNALMDGFSAATGDIIVMMDADGSTDPHEIPAFVGALLGGATLPRGRASHRAAEPPICPSTAASGTGPSR